MIKFYATDDGKVYIRDDAALATSYVTSDREATPEDATAYPAEYAEFAPAPVVAPVVDTPPAP